MPCSESHSSVASGNARVARSRGGRHAVAASTMAWCVRRQGARSRWVVPAGRPGVGGAERLADSREIASRPWGMRDFRLLDPSGYYLRLTEHSPTHPGSESQPEYHR